jgi:hypothetical protein
MIYLASTTSNIEVGIAATLVLRDDDGHDSEDKDSYYTNMTINEMTRYVLVTVSELREDHAGLTDRQIVEKMYEDIWYKHSSKLRGFVLYRHASYNISVPVGIFWCTLECSI